MQKKQMSSRNTIDSIVRRLATRPTNVVRLCLSLLLSLGAITAEAGFYRGYYKDEAVAAFQETPTIENFAKIESYHQTLALAEIWADTDRSDPKFAKYQTVFQHFYPKVSADDRAEIISTAFHLAVESANTALAKDLFNRGTASDPALAQQYICSALITAGSGDYAGDPFDEELFASRSARVEKLLPLIASVPRLKDKSCEISLDDKSVEEGGFAISIGHLVAKASPNFQLKLNQHGQAASIAPASLLQAVATCTEPQIRSFLNHQVMPTFSGMKKGGSQLVRLQQDQCVLDGIFKKVIIGAQASFEFLPSNGRFGYEKQPISFKTVEEFVKILKRGSAGGGSK